MGDVEVRARVMLFWYVFEGAVPGRFLQVPALSIRYRGVLYEYVLEGWHTGTFWRGALPVRFRQVRALL